MPLLFIHYRRLYFIFLENQWYTFISLEVYVSYTLYGQRRIYCKNIEIRIVCNV